MAKNGNRRPRTTRSATLRRDAEVTARARERRPEAKREEQAVAALKDTIVQAFEQV